MQPKIVERKETKIVGLQYQGKLDSSKLPTLWEKFMERIPEIKGIKNGNICYGHSQGMPNEEVFTYTAGVEAETNGDLPQNMVEVVAPAGKYAVWTHKGPIMQIGETFNKIYSEWLAESGLEVSAMIDIEVYEEGKCDMTENSEVDICIPVK